VTEACIKILIGRMLALLIAENGVWDVLLPGSLFARASLRARITRAYVSHDRRRNFNRISTPVQMAMNPRTHRHPEFRARTLPAIGVLHRTERWVKRWTNSKHCHSKTATLDEHQICHETWTQNADSTNTESLSKSKDNEN
jgi:hypothetical protein